MQIFKNQIGIDVSRIQEFFFAPRLSPPSFTRADTSISALALLGLPAQASNGINKV
jgi:hypothetical protein